MKQKIIEYETNITKSKNKIKFLEGEIERVNEGAKERIK